MRVVAVAFLMAAAAVRADTLPCPASLGADEALRLLNTFRSEARSCGSVSLPAAGPLRWNAQLGVSARAYAEELAQRGTLSHQGQRASTLRERLHQAGYRMRQSGENLAAGPETLEQALAQWMASPGHCDNLMFRDFQDMGLACVASAGRYERVWVLHLGRSAGD